LTLKPPKVFKDRTGKPTVLVALGLSFKRLARDFLKPPKVKASQLEKGIDKESGSK